jgi:hypothetical protein
MDGEARRWSSHIAPFAHLTFAGHFASNGICPRVLYDFQARSHGRGRRHLMVAAGFRWPERRLWLTSAEIAAALGTAMGAGQPITPTDHKVCTWKASEGQSWVTVMIQTNAAFDAGKKLGDPSNGVEVTPVGELGDDAYYLAMNDQVGLAVKKGDVAFKVAAFQHGPLGPKQSVERALAGKILTSAVG